MLPPPAQTIDSKLKDVYQAPAHEPSVIIGTWAGFVLARLGRFKGFTLYTAMINAPLVIPEVIQGISLLLLFVEMEKFFGWPAGRGALTITLAHVSVSLSYVAVVIEAAHQCMTTRGVHKPGVTMVTSRMLGAFRDNAATRRELLAMIGNRGSTILSE